MWLLAPSPLKEGCSSQKSGAPSEQDGTTVAFEGSENVHDEGSVSLLPFGGSQDFLCQAITHIS